MAEPTLFDSSMVRLNGVAGETDKYAVSLKESSRIFTFCDKTFSSFSANALLVSALSGVNIATRCPKAAKVKSKK